MKWYFVKSPTWVKWLFTTQTWSIPTDEKYVYLTFDDGPIPEVTPWVLHVLNQFQIKATFFCIGDNVQKHPEVYKQVLAEGHQIGNHTFNHLNGWKTNTQLYLANMAQTESIIQNSNKLFRPPYGKITPKQSDKLISQGYKIIMWDVLSADFDQTITPEMCLQNVIQNTTSGSIIVFHDSIKAKINLEYALPKTIAYLLDQGYKFKTL
ncbi:polysaccharide deacetylase family protein [Flavobacterium agricola]|uniref:Polysaccharide deacetylase family protein n=1 Tax=Flavobacterium agricola TaxID=2870839 RepID=A0ABY6LZB1_9FLAO|nr:polysaccharide deacetylase family protein [Flavobacterium agricola]UYW00780.1 polysaccharide deacetylase family protein [Flavobacterium agricola]